ncbi:OmpA family protein [Undibacterium sp. SXout7W]|uniref:OmpA family protein n=1 Tax=Undibacterium sp. SXout7W TaxID=3413049 RepID=UPI003BF0D101
MSKITVLPGVLFAMSILAACSTAPKTTSLLESTRQNFQAAKNNANLMQLAPLEMRQASDAMSKANEAASNNESAENINNLAYLAKQKIDLAQEFTKQKIAEESISTSAKERDDIRLRQRTQEADRANSRAQQAEISTQVAQSNNQDAQQKVVLLSSELAELKAKNTERGIVITLGDLLFGIDDVRLNPEGLRIVQKLAAVLQTNVKQMVQIEGYTDSTGTKSHNLQLSERRASAVRSALQLMGISRDRIGIHGYGEEYPLIDNLTAENRQLNRRVEIVLSDVNGMMIGRQ